MTNKVYDAETVAEHSLGAIYERAGEIQATCHCGYGFSATDEHEVRQEWADHLLSALSTRSDAGLVGWRKYDIEDKSALVVDKKYWITVYPIDYISAWKEPHVSLAYWTDHNEGGFVWHGALGHILYYMSADIPPLPPQTNSKKG